MKTLILILIASSMVVAEDWICKEASSQRAGNGINACGVGEGQSEDDARSSAFLNARKEFYNVCNSSEDCKNHGINVIPQRTSCEATANAIKCYRLVRFEILETRSTTDQVKDQPMSFIPYSAKDSNQFPKIKKGMSIDKVLQLFGEPKEVYQDFDGTIIITYNCNKICEVVYNKNTMATIIVKNKKVVRWVNIDFKYTNVLE